MPHTRLIYANLDPVVDPPLARWSVVGFGCAALLSLTGLLCRAVLIASGVSSVVRLLWLSDLRSGVNPGKISLASSGLGRFALQVLDRVDHFCGQWDGSGRVSRKLPGDWASRDWSAPRGLNAVAVSQLGGAACLDLPPSGVGALVSACVAGVRRSFMSNVWPWVVTLSVISWIVLMAAAVYFREWAVTVLLPEMQDLGREIHSRIVRLQIWARQVAGPWIRAGSLKAWNYSVSQIQAFLLWCRGSAWPFVQKRSSMFAGQARAVAGQCHAWSVSVGMPWVRARSLAASDLLRARFMRAERVPEDPAGSPIDPGASCEEGSADVASPSSESAGQPGVPARVMGPVIRMFRPARSSAVAKDRLLAVREFHRTPTHAGQAGDQGHSETAGVRE